MKDNLEEKFADGFHFWNHGADGSYLTEFLLSKGYEVHGSSAGPRLSIRIVWITSIRIRTKRGARFYLHYGDLANGQGSAV